MNPVFALVFAFLLLALLVTELVGVASKRKGDTLTEGWRWIRDHLPGPLAWFFRIVTAGLLIWAILHFLADAD